MQERWLDSPEATEDFWDDNCWLKFTSAHLVAGRSGFHPPAGVAAALKFEPETARFWHGLNRRNVDFRNKKYRVFNQKRSSIIQKTG